MASKVRPPMRCVECGGSLNRGEYKYVLHGESRGMPVHRLTSTCRAIKTERVWREQFAKGKAGTEEEGS